MPWLTKLANIADPNPTPKTIEEFSSSRNIFSTEFNVIINDEFLRANQALGKVLKPHKVATLASALSDLIKAHIPPELLGTEIWVATNVNGEHLNGWVIGTNPSGQRIIVFNPTQATADYVPGLLHEVKHLWDEMLGHDVSKIESINPADHQKYRGQPSEQRAEDFSRQFLEELYQKSIQSEADPT